MLSIIGLMVILIFGTTLFKSTQENEKDYIEYLFESPVVVHNDLYDPTLTVDVIEEMATRLKWTTEQKIASKRQLDDALANVKTL